MEQQAEPEENKGDIWKDPDAALEQMLKAGRKRQREIQRMMKTDPHWAEKLVPEEETVKEMLLRQLAGIILDFQMHCKDRPPKDES